MLVKNSGSGIRYNCVQIPVFLCPTAFSVLVSSSTKQVMRIKSYYIHSIIGIISHMINVSDSFSHFPFCLTVFPQDYIMSWSSAIWMEDVFIFVL